jgi:hypothetical protein
MGMRYRDLTGRQGDWLVKVTWEDGSIELVPTAHDKFYDGATGIYRRTDNSMERFKGKLSSWKIGSMRPTRLSLPTTIGTPTLR